MAGAIGEDTARTIGRGRDAVGGVLSNAQSHLKKVFLIFLFVLLVTIWALRAFVWDMLKQDLLYARMSQRVIDQTSVVVVTPFDVILLQLKIGVVLGAMAAIPALVWFGRRGLRERGLWPGEHIPRWKVWTVVLVIVGLFCLGFLYAYELFFPLMFDFLATNAVNAGFTPTYSIVKWTEFIVFLMLSFGLAAQLPLAMSAVASAGIIKYETFRDKWRYAVLAIFAFGAVFSPPDPFTQIMWAVPLVTLYWFSLGITKLVVLGQRAGEHVPIRGVVRDRWNLLAGTFVLAAGGTWVALTGGGLELANELLRLIQSDYRAPTAEELTWLGLAPDATAALVGVAVAVVATAIALFYFRIEALEGVAAAEMAGGPAPASAGDPAEIDIDVYKLPAGERPPTVASAEWRYDGVVVSGSQTSVYEDRDWIHEATAWVRRVHAAGVPILGICWGHQFIAQALGGRVVDMDEYELGYRQVSRVGEDQLFDGVPAQFVSFETHSDRVAELPTGAATLARNDAGLQAFRVGSAWGVQFHPEYDRQTAEWVIESKDLPEARIEQLLDRVTEQRVAEAVEAKQVFDNFVAFAADHQPVTRESVRY